MQEPLEVDLWRHFKMITVTETMTQRDDVTFAGRVKEKSELLFQADRDMLSQTVTEPELYSTDDLHILTTITRVYPHN